MNDQQGRVARFLDHVAHKRTSNSVNNLHHDNEPAALTPTAVLPNILIIITDQERTLQHWPETFSQDYLPSMERLKKHGLDFQEHYTNTCMCSPSRATLLTSQFPSRTGVMRYDAYAMCS
jgi:hypothetical protein